MKETLEEEICRKISLRQRASRDVELEDLSGGRHVGCCPFHKEATASFMIKEHTNRFQCFGCGAKGDIIDYVTRIEERASREETANYLSMFLGRGPEDLIRVCDFLIESVSKKDESHQDLVEALEGYRGTLVAHMKAQA